MACSFNATTDPDGIIAVWQDLRFRGVDEIAFAAAALKAGVVCPLASPAGEQA